MSANIIQAKYDELDEVANTFEALAEQAKAVEEDLTNNRNALDGEWVGYGSRSFFEEMDSGLIPGVQRTSAALYSAASTTKRIQSQLLEVETAEAERINGIDATNQGPNPSSPWGDAGTPLGTSNPTPPASTTTPFDPEQMAESYENVYDLDTIGELLEQAEPIKGAGAAELNELMEDLQAHMYAPTDAEIEAFLDEMDREGGLTREEQKQMLLDRYADDKLSDAELNDKLTQIAEIRGYEDPAEFIEQYKQVLANQPERKTVPIDEGLHPDFLGTTQNLQYGTVVGEILGIDPVLAVMLNPTGGLVGPGNASLPAAEKSILNIHGVYHDASGYLHNYHDIGEGYEYVDVNGPLKTSNPVAGQVSGINFWLDKHAVTPSEEHNMWNYDNPNDGETWKYD